MRARRHRLRIPLAALAAAAALPGAAGAESPWPFDPPPARVLRASPRKVFAHYFTPFPISLDNKEPEKDYSESAEIAPSTGTQYAFYDLTAYYTAWFKTGQPPPIRRDVLYYFHRVQATTAAPDPAKQPRRMAAQGGEPPRDEIELLAFLAAPGVLEIEVAGKAERKEAPAGVTSFKVPLAPGRPSFRLLRDGRAAVTVKSAFEIADKVAWQDLLYRGGSSGRPPVPGVR